MAIEQVIVDLRNYLNDISRSSTQDFLDEFAAVHSDWHAWERRIGLGQFSGQPIDFLSFHHEVVDSYIGVLGRNSEPVPGPLRFPVPAYTPARIDPITDPYSFSKALEQWHNLVHNNTRRNGGPYPDDFSDGSVNIYLRNLFWPFHFFIEAKFRSWLERNEMRYEDVDHTIM